MRPADPVRLTPGKRVLFLTKDPEKIRAQLAGTLDLTMDDVRVEDLLDDVNTDAMTPAWVCFRHRPEDLALDAYAGLVVEGKRLFPTRALMDGNFEVIVSGFRKGTGSSRETAVQAEKWSGIRIAIAASFAPIHARNNVNQGVLMAGHDVLARLQKGEGVALDAFTKGMDPVTRLMVHEGGLFPFVKALREGRVSLPPRSTAKRPMTIAEKIYANHLVGDGPRYVKPGDPMVFTVDGGYSHEFTTAQVDWFLEREYGAGYAVCNPAKFAVFEDHLIYATGVPAMAKHATEIELLRGLQREFQRKTGVRDYSAKNGVSPGICHEVAREEFVEPGDLILATDSHTCMGGGNGALAYGVGATEYAEIVHSGTAFGEAPESIRFELTGRLRPGVMAKDLMLFILANHARRQETLDRVMEFGGPGLASLSMDERATIANMATECTAKSGICEADEETVRWIAERRRGVSKEALRARCLRPDPGAVYGGGVHSIDLSTIVPMVAHPGDPDRGIPSDPTNGARVSEIGDVAVDIAYGGSCTAGKQDDVDAYAEVLAEALAVGRKVASGVRFFLQFGSQEVEAYAKRRGYLELFHRAGVTVIHPGCGACIGCGPGVSDRSDQVTVSAINRNFKGRSGPGRLWLASPSTVAASAITGRITAYERGMFLVPQPAGA
jgi:3-isopropylmalate/(R)-2-methylmalate dehydratase large subunit